jgi:hypothetical protein
MYRRFLKDTVTITRLAGASPSQTSTAATSIRAHVASYSPQEIVGAIMQGDQKVILLKQDLDAASWPVPPHKGDKIITSDGRHLTVQFCDANTKRVGNTIIAYEIQARGT